ncbi:MAG: SCO family protein [Pelistega sp.]|nr:SCO family protein [Pelistega sp.]
MPALAQDSKPTTVYNIKGNLPDLKFELQGLNKTVNAEDLKGKATLVFFGYASCPDICPTTMAELATLKKSLGEHEDKVQIVFISVDPHRDTPEILQAYVDAFESGGLGLTGTTEQIAEVAKRYRVAYQIEKPKPGAAENNYEVMHAQGIYIFDEKGKARFLASNAENTELLKEKLLQLWN